MERVCARGLVWRGTTYPCLKCNSAVHIWYRLQHQLPIPSNLCVTKNPIMPYFFYINLKLVLYAFNPHEETKMSNKRNKGDDAPHTQPFVGRVVTIPTPQYHTASLKENHYVQQSLHPQHLSFTLVVWL
jgi:hypothetical protein